MSEHTFSFVVIGGIYRLFQREAPKESDWGAFAQFACLFALIAIVVLAAVR